MRKSPSPEHQSKDAAPSRWSGLLEHRGDIKRKSVALAMGATALATGVAVVAANVEVGSGPNKTTVAAEVERAVEYLATQVAIGGHTDNQSGFFVGMLQGTGRAGGDNLVPVQYPAQIAPLDQMTMVQSDQEGADVAYNDYLAARGRGEDVVITGFSQGADVATVVAMRIAAENGGVLPPGVRVVTFGNPDSSTGVWESPVGQLIGPELGAFGLPTGNRLPAGSEEHSSQNDVYGNSANQYALAQLAMLTDVGVGHRVAAPWEETLSWTDQYGVTHYRSDVGVHPWIQLAMANGLYVNEAYNAALNDMVPVNPGNLDVPPSPNAAKAIMDLARAFDEQAGTGQLFQTLAIPLLLGAPLFQVGLDIADYGPNAVIQIAADVQNGVLNVPNVLQNGVNGTNVNRLTDAQPTPVVPLPDSSPVVQPLDTTLQQGADNLHNIVESSLNQFVPHIPGLPTPEISLPPIDVTPNVPAPTTPNVLAPVQDTLNNVVTGVTDVLKNLPQMPQAPAPVAEAPVAVVSAPVVEAPAPVVEAPAPIPVVVEAPAPAPVVEAPAPVFVAPVELPPAPAPVQEVLQNVVDQVQEGLPNLGDVLPAPAQ